MIHGIYKLSKEFCKNSENNKELLISLMKSAGIEVDDIIFDKPKLNIGEFPDDIPEVIR
ncbi:hypothetical protein QG071_10210 [Kingella kingae]|uniref:hypothetical protein n=1 Tax=Kingella kingae TaxID=504 RepID=UPI000705E55A|nr:hypothetical protein [Kingella kingae]MDK4556382.1 hypothetical protein [Kingella kingae]MDK4585489.1 hypothetical protein [Kingella kingae]MDK4589444.1 hypothetical protein [Kingella kingae]MDK4597668.1 hypothetical protein [Kingella kingae]MDK4601606.1 hypothetical protein [Kingella kingae]